MISMTRQQQGDFNRCCDFIARMIEKYGDDWTTIFSEYQISRKPNADAIAELSYRNFMEMSSDTASEKFLLQKEIEKYFSEKFPEKWMPLYSRVTFSHRPYAEALTIGDKQDQIMDEIMEIENIENIWKTDAIEQKIIQLLDS